MKSNNSPNRNTRTPPRRTHRGGNSKSCNRNGSATRSSTPVKCASGSNCTHRYSTPFRGQLHSSSKTRTKDKVTVHNGCPPAVITASAGRRSEISQSVPAALAASVPDRNSNVNVCTRSAHVDGDTSADVELIAEDSEVKGGTLKPPSERPHRKTYGDAPNASAQAYHVTPAHVGSAHVLHSLAPPPRRKRPHTTTRRTSSSSVSSRTRSYGSASSGGTSVSSVDDDSDSSNIGPCRRCLHNRHHKTKKHRLPAMQRPGGSTRSEPIRAHRKMASVPSRHSCTICSPCSNRVTQKGSHASATLQKSSSSESEASDSDRGSVTSTATAFAERSARTDSRCASPSSSNVEPNRGSEDIYKEGEEHSREDDGDDDDSSEEDKYLSRSTSADDFLSSSPFAASPCALTDILPRDLYLHICSFLNEVDCCTLLEVSLRMHVAITCADSYVWRRLCMATWQYKQGFQTFIQRIRALEGLARREEREVQALQQHMLLLREQDTFFGESDLSATCDDATVLIRRRQHEQAQWMAAAQISASPYGSAAAGGFARAHCVIPMGSSSTSTSSKTLSYGEDDEDGDTTSDNNGASRRWRQGRESEHRRSAKKTTHRSSTAAATASTSRRSGKQSLCSLRKKSAAHSKNSRSAQHSRASTSCPVSEPSTRSERSPSQHSHTKQTKSQLRGTSSTTSFPVEETTVNFVEQIHVNSAGEAGSHAQLSQGSSRGRSPHFADTETAAYPCSESNDNAPVSADAARDQDDEGRCRDRRVRIRLPEDVNDDAPYHYVKPTKSHENAKSRSTDSVSSSSPTSPNQQTSRPREHKHLHHNSRQQGDTLKWRSTAPSPMNKHRRSHSVKKRKPAKQRRRKRGRSRRLRGTGGGGGRHRSQHHRSHSRHHRSSRQQQHHHHHHHNPKASKSTRRRRRRQRNAAAAAAAAQTVAANSVLEERKHAINGGGAGSYASTFTASSGGTANGTSHSSTYFYQTPTYEAIKSTTPVLSVQHVAPAPVPFQLGGGRPVALQGCETNTSTSSPVVNKIPRYPSRDVDVTVELLANGPPNKLIPAVNTKSANNNNNDKGVTSRVTPGLVGSWDSHSTDGAGAGATKPPSLTCQTTSSTNTERERMTSAMVPLSRPPPLLVTAATAGVVTAGLQSHAPLITTISASASDEDGLYWWQLTPEARQQQLRRMQQWEHRQQQRKGMAATTTTADGGRPSRTSPDGDEVADEAALREWDALGASFGSSVAAREDEGGDDDQGHDEDGEDDAGSRRSTFNHMNDPSSRNSNSSSSGTDESEEQTRCNHTSSSRLHSRRHCRPSSFGDGLRNLREKQQRQRRRLSDASSATSSLTHTSPPSSAQSHRLQFSIISDDDADSDEDKNLESDRNDSNDVHDGAANREDNDSSIASSGHRTHPRISRSVLSSISPRLSVRAERQLAKALEKRYQAIEEAMIITRSKSVLIHTLERQTYAHLPRLLAAAAAQRQRRLMMTASRITPAGGAHADPTCAPSPGTAPSTTEATATTPLCTTDLAESTCTPEAATDAAAVGKPVLFLGSERPSAALPPAVVAPASLTLPSSLSNAFSTCPGVALAVSASPLHQLARIPNSTALVDGVVLHNQCSFHTPLTVQPTYHPHGETANMRNAESGADNNIYSHHLRDSADDQGTNKNNVRDDDDVTEDEEEPVAPVSWKFAYFMSRREARRAKITLQDLLEGMWLVCFRSTGRTHPILFTRQMQVLVYPPLKTAEEENSSRDGTIDAGSTTITPTATVARSGTLLHPSRPVPPVANAIAVSQERPNRVAAPTSTNIAATTTTAPLLPFHILQGGAQLVVHHFPPMKVVRRSAFTPQGESAANKTSSASTASEARCQASATSTRTIVNTAAGSVPLPRAPATEAEQRFAAEPHATLRRLQLRMMTMASSPSALTVNPVPSTTPVHLDGGTSLAGVRFWEDRKEDTLVRHDAHDAADVTQASVRRSIAQQLGFAAAYIADVFGPSCEKSVAPAPALYGIERREPFSHQTDTGGDCNASVLEGGSALPLRNGKEAKRCTTAPFGPPTLQEYEAQQRLEECFAPGGVADVLNDWGWTITGHHVKIFSLDVTAPLYVERLQRTVDEVAGRSHGEARFARRVS